MTILTKPSSEKKGDKLVIPLVLNEQLPNSSEAQQPITDTNDAEYQPHNILVLNARGKRVSTTVTLCLLLTALMVVGVGIVGGFHLYNQYVRSQMQRYSEFRGRANIPYDEPTSMLLSKDLDAIDSGDVFTFPEDFELNLNTRVEKIDVPDFRDGRSGRFIHDFNTNVTGIIDITGRRCFVMPLNRGNVLPPRSLFDLIHKMWDGYYKVDTAVVRQSMRVVTPPIPDPRMIGSKYIAKECEGRPVYRLEKYVGGVVKRSAELHSEAKFAQFAGRGITEFDIMNLEDVEKYEQQQGASQ